MQKITTIVMLTDFLHFCFRWLLSSGDKHIRVFHNVIGFQRTLLDLKQTLDDAVTQGHKDRLKQQIQELKAKLKSIGQQ